jgi:5-methylcytosine-specific restriction endonuclease McrA
MTDDRFVNHPMTVCITCGKTIPYGKSRCWEHGGKAWRRTSPAKTAVAYRDAQYQRNRATILKDGPLCLWCGVKPATTADHLRAVALGGGNEIENLVPACEKCNRLRGASLGGQVTKARRRQGNGVG